MLVAFSQTLGKLDDFIEENEVTGTCANGVCTVHGPTGKAEYSEVFEEFVPAFFAGAQVMTFQSVNYNKPQIAHTCPHFLRPELLATQTRTNCE